MALLVAAPFLVTSLGFVLALPLLFSLLLLPVKVFLPNILLGVTSGHSLPCGSGPIQSSLDSYTCRVEGAFGCHPHPCWGFLPITSSIGAAHFVYILSFHWRLQSQKGFCGF